MNFRAVRPGKSELTQRDLHEGLRCRKTKFLLTELFEAFFNERVNFRYGQSSDLDIVQEYTGRDLCILRKFKRFFRSDLGCLSLGIYTSDRVLGRMHLTLGFCRDIGGNKSSLIRSDRRIVGICVYWLGKQ